MMSQSPLNLEEGITQCTEAPKMALSLHICISFAEGDLLLWQEAFRHYSEKEGVFPCH